MDDQVYGKGWLYRWLGWSGVADPFMLSPVK